MTRRRNHMFENTSCPLPSPTFNQPYVAFPFYLWFKFHFYCLELIYQKFPKRQNTKGNQNKDKIEPECIHFSAKRLTGMLSKYSFFEKRKVLDAGSNSPT